MFYILLQKRMKKIKELQNLKEEIIQSDDDIDIKADENSYLDSLWDDEYEDMDSLINNYLFYGI